MTTKEVLNWACCFMGKEELLNSEYFEENGEALTEEQTKELNVLNRCLNLVISEIASDYLPKIKQAVVEFSNFGCNIQDIDNVDSLQEILSVKSISGKNLRYKIIDNKIICQCNRAIIEYKIYPQKCSLSGECENFNGKIPSRVLAYGVCMEYYFVSLLYDDASIWENRFKTSLIVNSRKKGEIKLPRRGWY